MPSLEFEVYCGICGSGICNDTDVNRNKLTIECHGCVKNIDDLEKQIADLEEQVSDLERQMEEIQ